MFGNLSKGDLLLLGDRLVLWWLRPAKLFPLLEWHVSSQMAVASEPSRSWQHRVTVTGLGHLCRNLCNLRHKYDQVAIKITFREIVLDFPLKCLNSTLRAMGTFSTAGNTDARLSHHQLREHHTLALSLALGSLCWSKLDAFAQECYPRNVKKF